MACELALKANWSSDSMHRALSGSADTLHWYGSSWEQSMWVKLRIHKSMSTSKTLSLILEPC